jgi:hypothetical protein
MSAYWCIELVLFINIESRCTEPWFKKKISIATREYGPHNIRIGVRFQVREEIFLLSKMLQTDSSAHQDSYSIGIGVLSQVLKRPGWNNQPKNCTRRNVQCIPTARRRHHLNRQRKLRSGPETPRSATVSRRDISNDRNVCFGQCTGGIHQIELRFFGVTRRVLMTLVLCQAASTGRPSVSDSRRLSF